MSKLPKFASEQEEALFWEIHNSMEFLDDTESVDVAFADVRPAKKLITLRLDPGAIERLKEIAQRKGLGYQTLIRMWVMERLTQEHV